MKQSPLQKQPLRDPEHPQPDVKNRGDAVNHTRHDPVRPHRHPDDPPPRSAPAPEKRLTRRRPVRVRSRDPDSSPAVEDYPSPSDEAAPRATEPSPFSDVPEMQRMPVFLAEPITPRQLSRVLQEPALQVLQEVAVLGAGPVTLDAELPFETAARVAALHQAAAIRIP